MVVVVVVADRAEGVSWTALGRSAHPLFPPFTRGREGERETIPHCTQLRTDTVATERLLLQASLLGEVAQRRRERAVEQVAAVLRCGAGVGGGGGGSCRLRLCCSDAAVAELRRRERA